MSCGAPSERRPANGVRSTRYGGSSNPSTAGIGRQSHGVTPPGKTYGDGHTTPAGRPSRDTWISRNAPPPQRPFAEADASGWIAYGWDSSRVGMYSLRTFSTCHVIPAGVGSGVVPMYTIVVPIQISASRSNWRPFTFPVQSRTTIDHGGAQASGGMYVPVAGTS